MKSNELDKLKEISLKIRGEVSTKYTKRFGSDLGGCCAIASGIMFNRLKNEFPSIKIVMSEDNNNFCHCFLLYKKYIIDITATQFGAQDICIFKDEKKDDSSELWFWYGKRTYFNDVKKLKKHQNKNGWPSEQIYWSEHYRN